MRKRVRDATPTEAAEQTQIKATKIPKSPELAKAALAT